MYDNIIIALHMIVTIRSPRSISLSNLPFVNSLTVSTYWTMNLYPVTSLNILVYLYWYASLTSSGRILDLPVKSKSFNKGYGLVTPSSFVQFASNPLLMVPYKSIILNSLIVLVRKLISPLNYANSWNDLTILLYSSIFGWYWL